MSVSLPCSTAAFWKARVTNCAATVSLASCDDTMIGPLATPDEPLTTIFQVLSSAPPSAFIGMTASSWPSAIATPARRADARRVPRQARRRSAALNPSLRFALTFRPIDPPRTSGTLGSTISIEYGHSSVTATASVSTVRVQKGWLFWPLTISIDWANSDDPS